MPDFSWVPFYEELANVLLNYENNQKALVKIIKEAPSQIGKELPRIEEPDNNSLSEMDPFTFFCIAELSILRG